MKKYIIKISFAAVTSVAYTIQHLLTLEALATHLDLDSGRKTMEGNLVWQSCNLSTKFYDTFIGNYKVAIDGQQHTFSVETSASRLKLFYLSSIPLCLSLIGCLLRIQGTSSTQNLPPHVIVISSAETAIIVACLILNLTLHFFGRELVEIMRQSNILLEDVTSRSNCRKPFVVLWLQGKQT